ncbi:hypothetical protein [Chryseobacterium sp.]|uniref:hypothetical protein n=1 Tax=Chryseobacterium sp. TaxID=1871047 RepID=UPI002612C2CC|nr:hypothetical protein [Chryseobacterium sp.]
MKKSFHISIIFLLILFSTAKMGFTRNSKDHISASSSENQIGLKSSESVQQHDILFMASLAENDFDIDKTFFDLPFTLFEKDTLSWRSKFNSNPVISSASEFIHHYHLPRYLLFHNLKIRISDFNFSL